MRFDQRQRAIIAARGFFRFALRNDLLMRGDRIHFDDRFGEQNVGVLDSLVVALDEELQKRRGILLPAHRMHSHRHLCQVDKVGRLPSPMSADDETVGRD